MTGTEYLLFNETTLMAWKEIDEANWKMVVFEISKIFFDVGHLQFEELKRSVRAKDFDRVKRAAHSLKASCGNVGAEKAYDLLNKMEAEAENENFGVVESLAVSLIPTFAASGKSLNEFIQKIQAA